MEFIQKKLNLDEEAVDSAFKQIHYYANLPKHIKGMVSELRNIKPNNSEGDSSKVAHVVSGNMTVTMGKMNIPKLN